MSNEKLKQLPDAEWHQKVSFVKSGIRILGYFLVHLGVNLVKY